MRALVPSAAFGVALDEVASARRSMGSYNDDTVCQAVGDRGRPTAHGAE